MTAAAGIYRADLPGLIYFVRSGDRPLVKIGWALDPAARIVPLQCGNPDELRLLATVSGTMIDERAWQKRFAHLAIRAEWFALTAEMEEAIADREAITAQIQRDRAPFDPQSLPAGERYRSAVAAARASRMPRGAKVVGSVLDESKVAAILLDKRTIRAIAADYGVSKTAIQDIKMGRTWRHVSRPEDAERQEHEGRAAAAALSRELRGGPIACAS